MKKIGFLDFFLDEWHANNYPGWIRNNIAAKNRQVELAYAYAEIDKAGGLTTGQWCEQHQLEAVSSIEELVDKSDYLIILSPDHPEHHERLAQLPLQAGKPIYMDKTFSPDLAAGIRMFDRAEQYATPLFSSSALRFAEQLASYPNEKINAQSIEYIASTGPGQFDNYSVHQFEMIVAMMGTGANRLKSFPTANGRLLIIQYEDGRQASMQQMSEAPFQLNMQLSDGSSVCVSEMSHIFERLIDSMLDFFETGGKSPVPRAETLEIMALIEAGKQAIAKPDMWVEIVKDR